MKKTITKLSILMRPASAYQPHRRSQRQSTAAACLFQFRMYTVHRNKTDTHQPSASARASIRRQVGLAEQNRSFGQQPVSWRPAAKEYTSRFYLTCKAVFITCISEASQFYKCLVFGKTSGNKHCIAEEEQFIN